CRFEQSQYVAKGGKVVVNSANQKRAAARKESLSKLLDQIIGEAPKLSRLPATNDKDGFEATIQSYLINNPADVTNRYGSYLRNMEGPGGIPVESFVRSSMAQ